MPYTDAFTVSAPATVFLFGHGQAPAALPAIAMAVDCRATVQADSHGDDAITLRLPEGNAERVAISADEPAASSGLLAGALAALRDFGAQLMSGYELTLESDIPQALAGDAAAAVALTLALLRCSNQLQAATAVQIADLAQRGLDGPSPPNRCDHLMSSLGGKRHVVGDQAISLAGADLSRLVLGYPNAASPCGRALSETRAREAIDALSAQCPSFDLATTPFDDAMPMLRGLPDEAAGILYALLRGRELCAAAAMLLESESFEKDRLGEMIDEDHSLHRDYLGVSNDDVEAAIAAAKDAGALGAKVYGAGSAVLAYAPGDEDAVAKAIESKGWAARIVSVADGARLDAGAIAPPWA